MKKRFAWMLALSMLAWTLKSQGAFKSTVGAAGGWANTIAGVGMKGKIYTVESGGALYATDPATGSWKQLGKPDFANTAFIFDAGGKLCTIEKDGSMYLVDPANGSWKQSGKAGDWKGTVAGAGQKGMVYTVEGGGALYMTEPSTGFWTKIGGSDFAHTAFIFDAGSKLCTIEKDGNLYLVDPLRGTWKQSGETGGWKNTVVGASLNGKVYTVENDGSLFVTDPAAGTRTRSANAEFDGTRFLFSTGKSVYGIDLSGNLFAVAEVGNPSPAAAPAPAASAETYPEGDPALAGQMTFKFMGAWTGDTAPLEKDPEYKKQAAADPETTRKLIAMMQAMTMNVTLDGVSMTVMGQKTGPFKFAAVTAWGNTLLIENQDGPKQGVKSRVVFTDPSHIQVIEEGPAGKAMFFKKK
jgi:hypothetical protein